MKFNLDTANINDKKFWKKFNLVDGVTTNPSLLSKENQSPIEQVKKISKIVKGPISVQVTKSLPEEIIIQANKFTKIAKNIIVKVPANQAGYLASLQLKNKKIKLNVTLGFDPSQFAVFAKLNVDYFSMILGKTEDWGFKNLESVQKAIQIKKNYKLKTKILVASIRSTEHFNQSLHSGADVLTVPPSTWEKVFRNKYSELGLLNFKKDWNKINKRLKKNYE